MVPPDTYDHLFWGYAAIWFCIAAFVFVTSNAQRRQYRRLQALEREFERSGVSVASESPRAHENAKS